MGLARGPSGRSPAGLEPIDGDALLERPLAGDGVLLDIRPEREYAEGHLVFGSHTTRKITSA